jgi:hypothetical protein
MVMLAIERAAHLRKGPGKGEDLAADEQIVVLGSGRMPNTPSAVIVTSGTRSELLDFLHLGVIYLMPRNG